MQYRRREEHVTVSPSSKLRAQHRLEVDPDPYRRTRREGSDRSPVSQRNLSPQKVDGLIRRGPGGANKGGTTGNGDFERRDYDWHLGGRRSGRIPSRSPPAEQVRKRSHFDDGVRHRSCSPLLELRPRYELPKTMEEYNVDDENLDAELVYFNREKEMFGSRLGGGQGMVDHKLTIRENEVRGSYRSIPDMGVSSQYEETSGHLPYLSRSVAMGRFEHERLQHRDPLPSDKMPITEPHKVAEKTILHARDVSYSTASPTFVKDFASTSQLRDYGSSSLEMARSDFPCSHGDSMHLPTSYELSRSSGKLPEPVGFCGHGQRPPIDTTRDPETGQRNIMFHQRCEFSPTRTEHVDYVSSKLRVRAAQDGYVYQYDDLPRRMAPHGRLDYEQALMEYDNRDLSRPSSMHPDLDRNGQAEDSYGNQRRVAILDHPGLQKPNYFDYHDARRTSIASKQGEVYLHSGYNHNHYEVGKRMPQDYEVSYPGASEDHRLSILRSEYESRRDGGSGLQQERFQSSPLSKRNSETYRQAVRVQEMKLDHDHSDRLMKRKYNANDDIDVHDLRTTKSSNWNMPEEFQDLYENEELVGDEDTNLLYSSGNLGFSHKMYRKYKTEYNELENEDVFPSDDWISPQDSMGRVQRHSSQFRKYSGQNIKLHPKSSSSTGYKSQHFSRRNVIHKQPKVWKKYHGYDENTHTVNEESSEDWISATEAEPSEGSEEFKQMVHETFLMYSKKLNLNSFVQRRYKDQGKAGSLYCIVCGRSASKEFMDTKRLVTHAFMSHKAGLRAKHLALHKAICVLLGWDTVVPQETVTWVPQVLPHAEALAQKEDLILWSPIVIIHNISMSDDNPQNWKVVSMETIEAFLRGKGFVRGRIKLCLGKPADQSIVLVKFLGTFVGLGDAERLHKYLSDSNRGRAEYESIKSESSKISNIGETGVQGEQVENILYGYLGIAEDLDKLDFNSKKWSTIKSRKEIDDLDNAPVKTNERS